jgi:hypothetical protein
MIEDRAKDVVILAHLKSPDRSEMFIELEVFLEFKLRRSEIKNITLLRSL